jgi:hypothetical protein
MDGRVEGYCYDAELVSVVLGRQEIMAASSESHHISNVLQQYVIASGYYEEVLEPKPEEAKRLAAILRAWVLIPINGGAV